MGVYYVAIDCRSLWALLATGLPCIVAGVYCFLVLFNAAGHERYYLLERLLIDVCSGVVAYPLVYILMMCTTCGIISNSFRSSFRLPFARARSIGTGVAGGHARQAQFGCHIALLALRLPPTGPTHETSDQGPRMNPKIMDHSTIQ